MTRRQAAASLLAGTAARGARRKPNLLFLIADDHAGYALGAAGDKLAATPHLDKLAAGGVYFTRAICNSPVCTASRQSILTGLLPHAAGVTRLPTPLDPNRQTVARQLQRAGYRTAVFGKMHFNRASSPGLHGFDYLMTERDVPGAMPKPRPIPPGIPVYERTGPSHQGDYRWQWPAHVRGNSETLPWPRYYDDMPSTFVARQAIRFLEENAARPFALWASFFEPHAPYRFPVELRGRYRADQFRAPRIGPEDQPQIPLTFRPLTPEQIAGATAAYYTSVHYLDSVIGEVLGALQRLRLEEDTLVVYMADHGYCLGHHGRMEKHCGYEQALHVPLIFRRPGKLSAARAGKQAQSLDVPPTLLDLLGVDPLPAQHGASLRPVLDGRPQSGQPAIFSEYLENEEAYLRTERWKFIHCSGKRERGDGYETDKPTPGRYVRLFDLKADPGEFHDVAPGHPDVIAKMTSQMIEVFRRTHPDVASEPSGLRGGDLLDWYLRPRDA